MHIPTNLIQETLETRLPELDNKNVVYELHDEKIAAVYTMDEVLDAKMDVEFSTKDGITYRKGKLIQRKRI